MAEESEETLDDRLERIQRRVENFRDLLKDGEEIVVALQDGEMKVAESYRSKFERHYPKLFGRMLSVEAQMDAGLIGYFAALVLAGIVIFGLQLAWWEGVLGAEICYHLQSWWFYIELPLAALYLAYLGIARWEKFVYGRSRPALLELIAAAKLDRDVMLVMLRDEGDLDNVVRQLKLDTGPFPQP